MRPRFSRSSRPAGLLALVLLIVLGGLAAILPGGGPALVGPRPIYLALGDSIGYGYQPNFDITHGYADALLARLKPYGVEQLVNLSCPGETTTTMLQGGCRVPFFLKSRYRGSQLEQAQQLIRANQGRVSPVTLTIGANDVLDDLGSRCAENAAAFNQHLARLERNLDAIVRGLTGALDGRGDLLITTYYNPFEQACPNTARYLRLLNERITAVGRRYGARVVDIAGAFAGRTCELTWMCSTFRDIHATTTGYQAIAERLAAQATDGRAPARTLTSLTPR